MTEKKASFSVRSASRHGTMHRRLNLNNQDAVQAQTFAVPAIGKYFHVGLVSDGCTGNPMFSHTEVGAHLLSLYAYKRIQELICTGVPLEEIPKTLFSICTEFLWGLINQLSSPGMVWAYPGIIKGREKWDSVRRLKTDYLAATLLGFICDEDKLVTFTSGDGIVLVNDDVTIIDQNDQPEYPVISVNAPSTGFATRVYDMSNIQRVAVMTDGMKDFVKDTESRNHLFMHMPEHPLGLQLLLNVAADQHPERVKDDATLVTLFRNTQTN